ncbi:MAG: hypothetical protein ACFCU6_00915 [Balneolaceae bacterium]
MMPKELFKEILEDPTLKEKIGLSDADIENIEIDSIANNDYLKVLKIILFSQKNQTPKTSTYTSIKNHFGIN